MIRRPPSSTLFPYPPLFRSEPHATPALSYSVEGKTRMLTLGGVDLSEVEAGIARHEAARAELETRARSGIEALRTRDRKSTRLNSSHSQISYAVFCLKKKKE